MNGPDPGGGKQRHDRLGAHGHVDRETVSGAEAEPAQARCDALDRVRELGVGEDAPLAALVRVDERGAPAPPALHVVVDALPGEIRFSPAEPAEGRWVGLEHGVPAPEPRELGRRPRPEALRVRLGVREHAPDERADQIHTRN